MGRGGRILKAIYKYPLKVKPIQTVELPLTAKVLSADTQGQEIVIYGLVDVDMQLKESYEVQMFGTGHNLGSDIEEYTFLDTIRMNNGNLMVHVFYKKLSTP